MARSLAPPSSSLVLLLVLLFSSSSAGWVLQDDYSASNWFSSFSFFTDADPTHGLVDYVSQSAAQQQGLISNKDDQIYMGVDHTNLAPNGRASVRLTSTKTYNAGTLMVLDLEHMPEGLGTWPAFWTVGPNWPAGGEIDIIEGVHNQASNSMTLHTSDGCSISGGSFSGKVSTSNCFVNAPGQGNNVGCSIDTPNTETYGRGLNAIGGGAYVMEWTTSAISVYFFPRGEIPSDITSGNPNPATWGVPLSQFKGCNIPQFFKNHQIVFDTTFCGDWAGNTWSTSGGQSSTYPTCNSYVANNPKAFADAYWQINSLKVYTVSSYAPTDTTSSDVPVTTEEAGNNNNQTNNNNNQTSNANPNTQTSNNNNGQASSSSSNYNAPSTSQAGGHVVPQVTGSSGVVVGSDDNQDGGGTSNNDDNKHAESSGNHGSSQTQSGTSHSQAGNSGTSGQPSSGGTSSASGSAVNSGSSTSTGSTTAPATEDEPPQAAQVGDGGVIFEGAEKLKARSPGSQESRSSGDWQAHLQREKERRSRHKRHGKRHVRPVGPAGGVWRR